MILGFESISSLKVFWLSSQILKWLLTVMFILAYTHHNLNLNMLIFLFRFFFAIAELRTRGAPLVRKYDNASVRQNLVLVTVRPYVRPPFHVCQF